MPNSVEDRRFTLDQLTSFYNDFRRNAAFDNTLDAQTFTTLLVTGIQSRRVPRSWHYMAFENFGRFVKIFKRAPLSDENAESGEVQEELFSAMQKEEARVFVDWKLIMLSFILLNSN